MKCENCNKEIKENSKFCSSCGKEVKKLGDRLEEIVIGYSSGFYIKGFMKAFFVNKKATKKEKEKFWVIYKEEKELRKKFPIFDKIMNKVDKQIVFVKREQKPKSVNLKK